MGDIPDYYHPIRPTRGITKDVDPLEIAAAYDLCRYRTPALKYILRAGRKPNGSFRSDIEKAVVVLNRMLEDGCD